MKIKTLQFYKTLLPKTIRVLTHKAEKGGYWAKIEGKGIKNCYTQAENFSELIEMVNDSVFTYLDVPKKFREKLGIYLPPSVIKLLGRLKREEEMRRSWELTLEAAMGKQAHLKRTEVFSLAA